MIDYTIVGDRLKSARIFHKLTQSELANELGVSTGYVCQVEHGDKCFNLNRWEKISKVLEKPITYFIGDAGGDVRSAMIIEILDILGRMSDKELDKTVRILEIIAT